MAIGKLKKQAAEQDAPDPSETARDAAPVEAPAAPEPSTPAAAPVASAPAASAPAVASSDGFDDDLASIEASVAQASPEAAPEPAAAPAPVAAAPRNPVQDMGEMLRERLGGEAPRPRAPAMRPVPALPPQEAEPARAEAPHDSPAEPQQPSPAGDDPLAGPVDLDGAEPSAEVPQEAAQPTELVRALDNNLEILRSLLASNGRSDPEIAAIGQEFVDYLTESEAPRRESLERLTNAQKLAQDEEERLRDQEAGRYASGGGGLFSMLGSLLARDPRAQRGGARAELAAAEAGIARDRAEMNTTADRLRTKIYEVKRNQYDERMTSLFVDHVDLVRGVNRYNEFFIESEAGSGFRRELDGMMAAEGIDRKEALARALRGDAPDSVREALAASRKAAEGDETLRAAKERIRAAEERIYETAKMAARDADIISRNFHDREKDDHRERAAALLRQSIEQMAEKTPPSLADEENRKSLQERMRSMAESIQAMVQRIMEKVLNAKLGGGMAPR